ncbi:MAG: hypothetical protein B7X10_03840, partial [Burkholderiales bacterium 21-58-4]
MADPLQPARQHVQEETADELVRIKAHPFRCGFLAVVFPAKRDHPLVQAHEAVVGDRYAVRVASQVFQYLLRAAEGALRIHHPLGFLKGGQRGVKRGAIDRKALGRVVFGHPRKLQALEKIIHPLIRAIEQDFLRRARAAKAPAAILEIPLLFETGAEARCDVTLCVMAPRAV